MQELAQPYFFHRLMTKFQTRMARPMREVLRTSSRMIMAHPLQRGCLAFSLCVSWSCKLLEWAKLGWWDGLQQTLTWCKHCKRSRITAFERVNAPFKHSSHWLNLISGILAEMKKGNRDSRPCLGIGLLLACGLSHRDWLQWRAADSVGWAQLTTALYTSAVLSCTPVLSGCHSVTSTMRSWHNYMIKLRSQISSKLWRDCQPTTKVQNFFAWCNFPPGS